MEQAMLVLTNLADMASARLLARALVEQRLAACVNMLPAVQSVYRWNDAVEEAADGAEAVGLLVAGRFAAIVTDVWMPLMDGIEVVRAIRKMDADVPVFVITGGGPGLSIASAATLAQVWGARKVYIKPFDVRDLVRDIRAAMDQR